MFARSYRGCRALLWKRAISGFDFGHDLQREMIMILPMIILPRFVVITTIGQAWWTSPGERAMFPIQPSAHEIFLVVKKICTTPSFTLCVGSLLYLKNLVNPCCCLAYGKLIVLPYCQILAGYFGFIAQDTAWHELWSRTCCHIGCGLTKWMELIDSMSLSCGPTIVKFRSAEDFCDTACQDQFDSLFDSLALRNYDLLV